MRVIDLEPRHRSPPSLMTLMAAAFVERPPRHDGHHHVHALVDGGLDVEERDPRIFIAEGLQPVLTFENASRHQLVLVVSDQQLIDSIEASSTP